MSERRVFNLSLAAKCRLLFSLAVVLIIASALFVPWRTLETLVHDRNVRRSRHLALLARAQLDPTAKDWTRQQERLDRWWDDNRQILSLPERIPTFIQLPILEVTPLSHRSLIEQVRSPLRMFERPLRTIAPYFSAPLPLKVTLGFWKAMPHHLRAEITDRSGQILDEVGKVIAKPPQELDRFQQRCVELMQREEAENEVWRTEKPEGQPTVYRLILGVRGEDTGAGRRPLIGLIDVKFDAPETDTVLLWTRVVIALAGLLAGFLAILVFYLIVQKFILAPVRELTALAAEVAGGDLRARAHIETADEFQALGDAFNDMLSRLEEARGELETINRSLDTRLGELAETNVALFESNRLKSEFLANVSHELRTPLTSIIGFADLLRDNLQSGGDVDKGRAGRFADNILTSGRMLLDLINDLLDLAKIEAGRVELHRTRFSLSDICEALSDFMRPLIDKKELTLVLDLAEDLPMMNSDAGKLRQILYNLLSNAVKYTPDGGTVKLGAAVHHEPGRVLLIVSDTGPGIAPEHQAAIFEKFSQLDASVTREHSGSGLGLAISKELVHLLGGTIRVESELGEGARFIVTLPIECPDQIRRPLPTLT